MNKTETKARAGTGLSDGLSPAAEAKSAMVGFLSEFRGFRDDIHLKLQQQEERLTMLDRKSVTMGRPALASAIEGEAPHQKAFEAYVRWQRCCRLSTRTRCAGLSWRARG